MSTTPGKLGPYEPTTLLATGGSAQIWLATDDDGHEVALKVARGERHRPAFLREAAVLRMGDHPGLVRLIDAGHDGRWLALERIRGTMMDEWAAGQSPEAIVKVAFELVETLQYLHGLDVVHGDLKPSNVIIDTEGRARILDLGISTATGDTAQTFRGTLGFAAPELLRNHPATPAADIYGLGATLYTCLTGRTPFVAPDPAALTYLPLVSLPPPPSTFRPDVPASLNQLLLALLAREPKRRPQSLERVKEALSRTMNRLSDPVFGMLEERETLRRAVVGAADGEARVAVIYGPPGSGRRTLIGEAVEYARREGLPYLKGSDLKQALGKLRSERRPSVMVHRAQHKGAQQLARVLLSEGLPCLLLLHSDRPVPSLAEQGAILLTPSPLSLRDVQTLVQVSGVDPAKADDWWRESLGLPIAIMGRIRAERRETNGLKLDPKDLPVESRRILKVLRAQKSFVVADLARAVSMNEHVLLDHCEVLFAERLVVPSEDGASIHLAGEAT